MKPKNKQGLVGLRVFGWLVLVALTLVAAWALPEPLKPLAAAGFGLVTILVIQGRALTVGRKLRFVWDGAGITSTSYRYDSKVNRLSVEVRPNILKAQWDRQQQCLTFLVHPNPGKTQQQIIDCGEAIRAHLRAEVVTATVEKRGLVRFLVFYRDPLESVHRIDLAREVPAGVVVLKRAIEPGMVVGVRQDGTLATVDLHQHHTLIAGATGAGKSCACYVTLAGIAGNTWVQVLGVDPSSITLAPFSACGFSERFALGTADMTVAANLLEQAVALMDRRIAQLLAYGLDSWFVSRDTPTIVVVLEELAGIYSAAESQDARAERGTAKVKPRIIHAVGRLLRESRKAGMTVVSIIQKPEAAVMGGGDRSQYSRRIAMRLDNADGVRMMFEGIDPITVEQLTTARPGVGLIAEPGKRPDWYRSHLLEYKDYATYVRQTYKPREVSGLVIGEAK